MNKIAILFTVFVSILCMSFFIRAPFLKSNDLGDNPKGCRYYITLQSVLANYPLLAGDKANVRFIQKKLLQFENDAHLLSLGNEVARSYKVQYEKILHTFAISSAANLPAQAEVIVFAKKAEGIVDGFYLDSRLFCLNPLYEWNFAHAQHKFPIHSRRILQYHLAGLYEQLPNHYMRILGSALDEYQLGAFSGFFLNNQTASLNTQFMTGIPMLTALYVLPGNDFSRMGSYAAIVPWNSFHSGYWVAGASMRKILNIAGIDVLTVEKTDLKNRIIPDTVALPAKIPSAFSMGSELQSFINKDSYGMAYLANEVTYENVEEVAALEKQLKQYFAHYKPNHPTLFLQTTHILYDRLRALNGKQSILLESLHPMPLSLSDRLTPPGSTEIKGIVGERAMVVTHCNRSSCTLVLNLADSSGWHAYVNGRSTTIERANYAFMATTVPKGTSTVWFIYQPWTSLLSYLVSLLTLIAIFVGVRGRKAGGR